MPGATRRMSVSSAGGLFVIGLAYRLLADALASAGGSRRSCSNRLPGAGDGLDGRVLLFCYGVGCPRPSYSGVVLAGLSIGAGNANFRPLGGQSRRKSLGVDA